MSDYIIMTDSSCDLPAEVAEKLQIPALPFPHRSVERHIKII